MNVRPFIRSWLRLALLPIVLAIPDLLQAQHTEVPSPVAYALQGVTVVQSDGRRTEGVTLVVRGAFIETIAAGAPIPADAQILDGDSLVVYPGLIDAQGAASYSFPEVELDRSRIPSWDPPRTAQGFVPHRRVVDFLTGSGDDLVDQRKRGIVAAAVYPVDGLMPGRGALLVYRRDTNSPTELVHTPDLGPVMTLRGGMGYPSTLFGTVAFYRQTFEDAARMKVIAREYTRDPRGLRPPAYDPDFEVVQEAMAGKTPTFIVANSAEDIRRVLDLAESYGLKPIIVGGEEAWRVADLLKARRVPVLVSLDFPKPQFWKPVASADEGDGEAGPAPDPVELREQRQLEEIYANAGKLAAAGVTFALTTGGGKATPLEGARKAIEYGLTESAALAALTASPAEILGIPQSVRLESGRAATFVVSNGPLFEKGSRIVYTFVEGQLERGEEPRPAEAGEASAEVAPVIGSWKVDLQSEMGSTGGEMKLEPRGSGFAGSIIGTEIGEILIEDGKVSSDQIEFQMVIQVGDDSVELSFQGTIDGSTISATGTSPFGSVALTATRAGGDGGAS